MGRLPGGLRGRGQRDLDAWAPWYIVPSDHKWYRNLVVARIVCATLEAMAPRWPETDAALEGYALEELQENASSRR